jgi:hypothetical protein
MARPTVRAIDIGVTWEPDAPAAVLVANDRGEAELTLLPHPEDADQRSVRLVWRGAAATRLEPPNDEARNGHPLWNAGLSDVLWIGEVDDSELVADVVQRNSVHPLHKAERYSGLRHWVVLLKEAVVEVVAEGVAVERADGV